MSEAYEVMCPDTSKIPREEWLELRRTGLGSSDMAGVMGLSPWSSAYTVFCEKRGMVSMHEENDRFEWGRRLEDPILQWALDHEWVEGPLRRHVMLRSTRWPWLLCDPDAMSPGPVLEVKSNSEFTEDEWDEGVPDQYVIQCHVLMAVTGTENESCYMPVAFGANAPRLFIIDWDPSVGEPMLEAAEEFWGRVQAGDAPDPDGSEATMTALRRRFDEPEDSSVELPAECEEWLHERQQALSVVKSFTGDVDKVKARLMDLMGNAEVALFEGRRVATWKENKNGTRVFRFAD